MFDNLRGISVNSISSTGGDKQTDYPDSTFTICIKESGFSLRGTQIKTDYYREFSKYVVVQFIEHNVVVQKILFFLFPSPLGGEE